MAPAIHLRGVVALAGRFPALAGVDLDVEPGETLLVSGPNGAGKTSLLRLLAGLTPPAAGEGAVLGRNLATAERTALRNQVGFLGHSTRLYGDLSAIENVRFALRAALERTGRTELDRIAHDALASVGVTGRYVTATVSTLSHGQRKRVALAPLVVRRPELWLLDEPHGGLDAGTRDTVDELVLHAAAAGATVVIASHEVERALDLADIHATLAGGRILSCERLNRGRLAKLEPPARPERADVA